MKKITAIILAAALFLVSGYSAMADDNEIKNEINSVNSQIAAIDKEIEELESQKSSKSKEIVKINSELSELSASIEDIKAKINENTAALNLAESQSQESFDKFSERLMLAYEQGSNAYIALLLGSEDLFDMIERINLINEISSHDREIYQKYKDNKDTIASKQSELVSEQEALESQSGKFNEELASRSAELADIVSKIGSKNTEKSTLNSKLEGLNTSLSSMNYADKLFAEAEKYLGMPYVFGGSTPETSFDCSGFVCYATTHSGVYDLPRTTAQGIYDQCIKITPAEAKRGDIIFFQGTYNAGETVTHVGFYAGDGKMLHCGNPIQYTSTQTSYWQSHFYAFGRLKVQ